MTGDGCSWCGILGMELGRQGCADRDVRKPSMKCTNGTRARSVIMAELDKVLSKYPPWETIHRGYK